MLNAFIIIRDTSESTGLQKIIVMNNIRYTIIGYDIQHPAVFLYSGWDLFWGDAFLDSDLDIKINNTGDNFNYISIISLSSKDSLAVKLLE